VRSTHRMPFNTDRRLFHGRPRPLTPSFRLGNQPIKNFPLVVAQISRSMTHMLVDATTGACG
jgi:hypothetical protein